MRNGAVADTLQAHARLSFDRAREAGCAEQIGTGVVAIWPGPRVRGFGWGAGGGGPAPREDIIEA
jgi:hypothetical protein